MTAKTLTDLGRRAKITLADFHDVIDASQKLGVDGKAAVELVAGLSHQTLGEFTLEHEHGHAEERPMKQQFEHQGRRDLIGHIGHARVEERQVRLDHIADHQLQFGLKQERG